MLTKPSKTSEGFKNLWANPIYGSLEMNSGLLENCYGVPTKARQMTRPIAYPNLQAVLTTAHQLPYQNVFGTSSPFEHLSFRFATDNASGDLIRITET
jgi:hypothetical protein